MQIAREVSRGGPHAQHGFTLIELLASFSALLVVLLGFSRMLLSSHMATSSSQDAALAKEAARSMIEVLQASNLDDVYARYNASNNDDPGGMTSPGPNFAVEGLSAAVDDADGLPGRILFPEKNGVLSELDSKPQYGWPMDMDRDGDPDGTADVSSTYQLLPVVVRVEWRGRGGDSVLEFRTVLGGL
jgi:type II secretory pathway pseudopilin PulG